LSENISFVVSESDDTSRVRQMLHGHS